MMSEDSRILPWHGARFTGCTLHRRSWHADANNDHDHCAFCWARFAEYAGCLHEGYCTEDERDWVCEECFNDFKERFGWAVNTYA